MKGLQPSPSLSNVPCPATLYSPIRAKSLTAGLRATSFVQDYSTHSLAQYQPDEYA